MEYQDFEVYDKVEKDTISSRFGTHCPKEVGSEILTGSNQLPDWYVGVEIEIEGIDSINNVAPTPEVVDSDEEPDEDEFVSPPGVVNTFQQKWCNGLYDACCYWAMHKDGSLRNGGREFVTKGAIRASAVPYAIKSLYNVLPDTADWNPRAGIHIHLNVNDLTSDQVRSIIALYCLFERPVFNAAAGYRKESVFCVPILDSYSFYDAINFKLAGNGSKIDKYAALNLLPLANYGTIEFRHFQSTNDVELITYWLGMICSFRTYVVESGKTFNQNLNDIFRLNTTSEFFLFVRKVFGPDLANRMMYTDMFKDMINSIIKMKAAVSTARSMDAVGPALLAKLSSNHFKNFYRIR